MTIGCGSASPKDKLGPALDLAESGRTRYLCFDRLAERTLALAQTRKLADPEAGHDERLAEVVDMFAPFLAQGGRIIGSFGGANPTAGVREAVSRLRKAGVADGLRVGVIGGDDVTELAKELDLELPEWGGSVGDLGDQVVSAHAYIGAEPIAELLAEDARFILGGRLADTSLFVAPICHELGWALDDWDAVATAALAAHILECGTYCTGANYADPPYRAVPPGLNRLGLPLADVSDGEVVVTKLDGSGGLVNEVSIKSQLGYEILDPERYLTPDLTADFSRVSVTEVGPDRVRLRGARGGPRPDTMRVLIGLDLGYKVVSEVTFGGPGCVERARIALDVAREQLASFEDSLDDVRYDVVGVDSLFGDAYVGAAEPADVRVRVAARSRERELVQRVAYESEYLTFGPAGGGGARSTIAPLVGVTPAFLARDQVHVTTDVVSV